MGLFTEKSYYFSARYTYTEADDVALVRELHGRIAAEGKMALARGEEDFTRTVAPYDLSFVYTFQDGGSKTWLYDRASFEQLESLLARDFPADSGIIRRRLCFAAWLSPLFFQR
jgi:hypothetical protein